MFFLILYAKIFIAKMTTHLDLNKFMQSLIALTKIRESLALEPVLLSLIQHWLGLFAGQSYPVRVQILSRRQLISVMDTHSAGTDPSFESWPADVYRMLLDYLDQDCFKYQCLETGSGKLHIFPLTQSIAHKNAILLIQHTALSVEDIELVEQCLQMFDYYAKLIIENERDALTGLLNRKTFDQCVSKILLNDYKPEYSFPLHHYLVIFDIDFFKRINDSYGHLIGDEVLILLSRLMRETFRDGDLLFRFGGEEFVGVFSCAEPQGIVNLLERFREALAEYRFPQVGHVTISIGCSQMALNVLPNTVLERADEALYYAKEHGRNQICYYESLIEQGLIKDNVITGEVEMF